MPFSLAGTLAHSDFTRYGFCLRSATLWHKRGASERYDFN